MATRPHHLNPQSGYIITKGFIDQNATSLHPSLDSPPPPPSATDRVPSSLQDATEEFKEAVKLYQQTARPKKREPFDLTKQYSWQDVIEQFAKAQSLYKDSGKLDNPSHIARRIGREVERLSVGIDPWLGLIPDGQYTSIVCGALRLVFSTAKLIRDKRDQVLDVMSQIPGMVLRAQDVRRYHPFDDRLGELAVELYVAILEATSAIIQWLNPEKPVLKRLKVLFTSDAGDKVLDDALKKVDESVKNLDGRCDILIHAVLRNTEDVVTRVEDKQYTYYARTKREFETIKASTDRNCQLSQSLVDSVDGLSPDIREMKAAQKDTQVTTANIENISSQMRDMIISSRDRNESLATRDDMQKYNEKLATKEDLKSYNDKLVTREDLQNFLTDDMLQTLMKACLQSAGWSKPGFRNNMADMRYEDFPLITQDTLLEMMRTDTGLKQTEAKLVRAQSSRFNEKMKDKAAQLLMHPRFQNWVSSVDSDLLIVDGVYPDALSAISPMSNLCATFATTVEEHGQALCLQHFCGLHRTGDIAGIVGLLRNFITQLLAETAGFDTRFIHDEAYVEMLEEHDPVHLFRCFMSLLDQLPGEMVSFMLIDSISCFELSTMHPDLTHWFVKELQDVVFNKRRGSAAIKVLFTSSYRTLGLHQVVPLDSHVVLQENRGVRGYCLQPRFLNRELCSQLDPFSDANTPGKQHRRYDSRESSERRGPQHAAHDEYDDYDEHGKHEDYDEYD